MSGAGDARRRATATRMAALWSSAADDDAVGVQEVVHRRALAEELGVGHDVHVGALQRPLDHPGRADRHRRLVDDDRLGRQHGADLAGGRLDVAEVGRAVGALGRGHAQVDELGRRRRRRRRRPRSSGGRCPGPPGRGRRGPASTMGTSPRLRALDLVGVDVGADDLVAEVGEARAGRQPDVTGPDDSDIGHGATRRPGRPGCWAPRRRHRSSWSPSRPRGPPASSRARFRRPRPPEGSGAAASAQRPRRSPCR